jgi:hypothetical protein
MRLILEGKPLGPDGQKQPVLRLSNPFHMNDYREIHHGVRLSQKIAERLESANAKDYVAIASSLARRARERGIYVSSFSQGRDRLSQWCRYANDGRGVSIGFQFAGRNAKTITKSWTLEQRVILAEVEYRSYEIPIRGVFTLADLAKEKRRASFDVEEALLAHIAAMKDGYFFEEAELRLIASNAFRTGETDSPLQLDGPLFRATSDRLIDFMDLYLPRSCIRSIRVGPACRAKKVEINRFLERCGFDPETVRVTRSKIPYRPGS